MSFLVQSAASGLLGAAFSGHQSVPAVQSVASASSASAVSQTTPFANLNLTAQEQAEISSILRTAQARHLSFAEIENKISGVLTPAQQQTLRADLQSLASHHGHRHHGAGGGASNASSALDSDVDAFGVPSIGASSPSTTTPSSSLFSDLAAQFAAHSQTQEQQSLTL